MVHNDSNDKAHFAMNRYPTTGSVPEGTQAPTEIIYDEAMSRATEAAEAELTGQDASKAERLYETAKLYLNIICDELDDKTRLDEAKFDRAQLLTGQRLQLRFPLIAQIRNSDRVYQYSDSRASKESLGKRYGSA